MFAGLAAFASLTGFSHLCYAQCDTTTAATTPAWNDPLWEHNVDNDYDGTDDPDPNGGCNLATPAFIEAGTLAPGSYRFTGNVGNYVTSTGGNSRDLDWIRFTLTQPGYVSLTLSMNDNNHVPMSTSNSPPTQSALFIADGSAYDGTGTYCAAANFIYGEYLVGDCPQVAVSMLPNGSQYSKIAMPAGEHFFVVTTPFNAAIYTGPCAYGINLEINSLDFAVCGTSNNVCTVVNTSGGCNNASCCDLVCGFTPSCCSVAWDATCVDDGVSQCGLFIYNCAKGTGSPDNDCAGDAQFIDSSVLPVTAAFDASHASNDGPNDVNALCSSNTTKDIWYVVGPLAYGGELRATMCNLGNVGDAVLSMYDLGTASSITDGSMLPSMYIGCRDDVCDDNNDGTVDLGGPAGIQMTGVLKDNYYAIRIGTFLDAGQDPADPLIIGLQGSVTISFRATVFSNGLQQAVAKADGSNVNLGWISGFASADNPKRWMFVPFFTTQEATVNGYDFTAFDSGNGATDTVNFKIITRDSSASDHGLFGRPFGNGVFSASSVLYEGSSPFDIANYADVGDRYGQRFFVDVAAPFDLAAGDYYFTTYASNSAGGDESFAWLSYGVDGMGTQVLTTLTNTGTNPIGPTNTGSAWGWRGVETTPTMIAYQLFEANGTTPTYLPQATDAPGLTYQPAFSIKGNLASACFGDIDGSGEVDLGDAALALLDYGPCQGCSADLDGSGEIDFGDIALILLSTGPCF